MSVKFDFEKESFPFSVCEKMSENFTKHPDEWIKGFKLGKDAFYDTEKECEDACRNNSQCLSFDTWIDNKIGCSAALVTYDMIKTTIPTKIGKESESKTNVSSRTCIEMN